MSTAKISNKKRNCLLLRTYIMKNCLGKASQIHCEIGFDFGGTNHLPMLSGEMGKAGTKHKIGLSLMLVKPSQAQQTLQWIQSFESHDQIEHLPQRWIHFQAGRRPWAARLCEARYVHHGFRFVPPN